MHKRDIMKTLNAGRSVWEGESLQIVIMIIAVVVDATLFYTALEGAITEKMVLNLVVTIGGCIALDISPLLLSKLVFADIDKKIKKIAAGSLITILVAGFAGMFAIRWSTRETLNGGSLGLMQEAVSSSSLDTVAIVLGYLPIMTSAVIFFMGILAYDPNKKYKDLVLASFESRKRRNSCSKKLIEYGTSDDRKLHMDNYYKGIVENNMRALDEVKEMLNEEYNVQLAEKINATGDQITRIMED